MDKIESRPTFLSCSRSRFIWIYITDDLNFSFIPTLILVPVFCSMAVDYPLVLYDCHFEGVHWRNETEEENHVLNSMHQHWVQNAVKTQVLLGMIQGLQSTTTGVCSYWNYWCLEWNTNICLFFLSKSSMWNHYETVIFLFLYFRGDFSAVLAHGGLQAEEVPASSGAAALWEFGVQDPALCEEGKTGARRRRERRGDDCVQGEKIKTFPSDDNKPTPGAKPWSKNWGEPVNFQLWTFYIICFDFNVTRRQNRNIFLNFFFYLCSLSSTNT